MLIYIIGALLLFFGLFPIGKFPFNISSVGINNLWVRIAGACIILGFAMIDIIGGKWIVPGIVIMSIALILIIIAFVKYIENG